MACCFNYIYIIFASSFTTIFLLQTIILIHYCTHVCIISPHGRKLSTNYYQLSITNITCTLTDTHSHTLFRQLIHGPKELVGIPGKDVAEAWAEGGGRRQPAGRRRKTITCQPLIHSYFSDDSSRQTGTDMTATPSTLTSPIHYSTV